MKHLLRPKRVVDCLFDISQEFLREKGIQGIIFDLDNTIVAWNSGKMEQEVTRWLSDLKENGFQLYIVSNSLKRRVREIADPLGIPYTGRAGKPLRSGFDDALTAFGLDVSNVAVVGDQLFTDIVGGNRIGAFTILVKPLSRHEFFTTKLTRVLERLMLKDMNADENEAKQ